MREDLRKGRYNVEVSPILLSRGTGEVLNMGETLVYDFMPRLLGEQFRTNPELRRNVHRVFNCDTPNAPLMVKEKAYRRVAEQELEAGNLTAALEAYKKAVWNVTVLMSAISSIQGNTMVDQKELDVLNVDFKDLEEALIVDVVQTYVPIDLRAHADFVKQTDDDEMKQMVVGNVVNSVIEHVKFDLDVYKDFLAEIRAANQERIRLVNLFYYGSEKGEAHYDASKAKNPDVGTQLRDFYVGIGDFNEAVAMSHRLDDEEGVRKYSELAQKEPIENPRLMPILWEINPKDSDGDTTIHFSTPIWEVIQIIREKDKLEAEKTKVVATQAAEQAIVTGKQGFIAKVFCSLEKIRKLLHNPDT